MTPVELGTERVVARDEVVRRWLEHRAAFLSFLRHRTTHVEAEEILQAAFVKAIERSNELRHEDAAVAWFYRLLRRALVDHQRKMASHRKKIDDASVDDIAASEVEPAAESCRCVGGLLPQLKTEHSDLLERVELRGQRVIDAAKDLGISANNAAVRLGRARRALRIRVERNCGSCAQHGCFQCSCRQPAA